MSNKVYDRLKNIALIIIPALTMLWTTIGETWNIPYTTQVAATISAVGVFLGASAAAALTAAKQLALRSENEGKNIVVIFPDDGMKYLSTNMYK